MSEEKEYLRIFKKFLKKCNNIFGPYIVERTVISLWFTDEENIVTILKSLVPLREGKRQRQKQKAGDP